MMKKAAAFFSCFVWIAATLAAIIAVAGPARADGTALPQWLLTSTALGAIETSANSTVLAANAFDNPNGPPTMMTISAPAGWNVAHTVVFDAFDSSPPSIGLKQALQLSPGQLGAIPRGTKYVIYDDEAWANTPAGEQADPATAMKQFVVAARAHNYKVILAPAVDLTTKMPCYNKADSPATSYLTTCDIPAMVGAADPDVYVVQGQKFQTFQGSTNQVGYAQFVGEAGAAESAAVPAGSAVASPELLGGISTNVQGAAVVASDLYSDVQSARGIVAGFWLNVPNGSGYCSTCKPAPDVAVGLLDLMGYQLPQTVSFSQPPASGQVGQSSLLAATSTAASTGAPTGLPVTFAVDPSSDPGVCSVTGATVSYLATGACVIDAQAGDVNWTPAQVSQQITVSRGVQTISFSGLSASPVVGGTDVLSGTPGASGVQETFSVDESSDPGVCSVSGSVVSYSAVGNCVVDASESGDADWLPAALVSQSVVVGQGQDVVSFAGPGSGVVGSSVGLSASAVSGLPVAFSVDGSSDPGVCSVSGSVVSYSAVGNCVLDASELGDADWLPAALVSQSVVVGQGQDVLTFAGPGPAAVVGDEAALTATPEPSTGTVSFSVDAASDPGVCAVSGDTVSYQAVGTCLLDADQAGDRNWSPAATVQQSVTVGKGSQALLFLAPSSGVVGGSAPLYAVAGPATTTVTFSVDAASDPGVCAVSAQTVSYLAAGNCVIDASQSGDANWLDAPTVTATFPVAPAPQSITGLSNPPTAATYAGSPYAPTAIGGPSGLPVTFATTTPAVCVADGSGTVFFVGVGTCTVTADQAGNANYTAAPTLAQSFPVHRAAQAIRFASPAPSGSTYRGAPYTVATSGGGSGNTVTLSTSTPSVCAVAGSVVSFVGVGTCTVVANQAGSADYFAAKAQQQSFAVGRAPQTITLTAPPGPVVARGPTYTLGVTGGGSGIPVIVHSGTPTVCKVTGFVVSFVSAGSCIITATQNGTSFYAAAPKVSETITVLAH